MSLETFGSPKLVLILSGKRKSGKDYVAEFLLNRLGKEKASVLRLSGPLKELYAKEHCLDYARLLDASNYKETYRVDMIQWGENMRKGDPGYFCRHAILQSNAFDKEIWIISDARRKTDLEFFWKNYQEQTQTVRIVATETSRTARGWIFTKGVDDAESECNLDDFNSWDFIIHNNGTSEELETALHPVFHLISEI